MNNLKECFDRYGADKSSKHYYHEIYEPLFEQYRDKEINFLEVGVWKGAGLAAFHDYFPKANLYGIDIMKRVKAAEVEVYSRDRVNYLECDSTNIATRGLLEDAFGVEFDIILDDGAHYPEANRLTFENLSPLLKDDGIYIIEDVFPLERMSDKELSHPWLQKHPQRYNHIENNNFLRSLVDSGLEIKRYDNRKRSGQPDSYIIKLQAYKS